MMQKLLTAPVLDALNSDRWRLTDSLSRAFFCAQDRTTMHFWVFASISASNATEFLVVAWGIRDRHTAKVSAFGASDVIKGVTRISSLLSEAMHLPPGGNFALVENQRFPWLRFVMEILPDHVNNEPPQITQQPEVAVRTIETMLDTIKLYGNIFNKKTAEAIAHLSNPTLSAEATQQLRDMCIAIGNACRDREMEAVYWPNHLWDEAMEGADIFEDANVPEHYLPDGPQLWYFESPLENDLDSTQPEYAWSTPAWLLSCMALLPINQNGKPICILILVFEKEPSQRETADDALPRLLIRSAGRANEPCLAGYTFCMAGLEFMQEVLPRKPFEYNEQEKRAAAQRGEKLPPYSIMEVRRIERTDEHREDQRQSDGNGSGRTYHYSFFQRRHRRKLKEPRKSDGVQVIRVAAGQKLKHLPLMPEAQQKVTKVSR